MFKGLRTVIYHVDDMSRGKEWYSSVFGVKPYFDQPYYVGFNIGGFELGLDPNMKGVVKGNSCVAYWGVENINDSIKDMIAKGAAMNTDIQDVGDNIKVASVVDPFGNVLGIIENPHFKYGGQA